MSEKINIPEISARFIPFNIFNGDFINPLNELVKQHIITHTEKEIMIILNGYSFKDGACYPKIDTIAAKAGISKQQVINVIKSLEKKGLLEVVRPSLLERKLYRQHNQYFFLFHVEYYQFFTLPEVEDKTAESADLTPTLPDTLPDILPEPSIIEKSPTPKSNKTPVGPFHIQGKSILPEINETVKNIESINTGTAKKRFNPVQAVGSAIKNNVHPGAIYEGLQAVLKGWNILENPWGYFNQIISVKSGNYHERDHARASAQIKADVAARPELKELLHGIG